MFEMLMLTGFLYAALARLLPKEGQKKQGGASGRARRDRREGTAKEAKPKPIARRIRGRFANPSGCATLFRFHGRYPPLVFHHERHEEAPCRGGKTLLPYQPFSPQNCAK